jgi:hypothetical protein
MESKHEALNRPDYERAEFHRAADERLMDEPYCHTRFERVLVGSVKID